MDCSSSTSSLINIILISKLLGGGFMGGNDGCKDMDLNSLLPFLLIGSLGSQGQDNSLLSVVVLASVLGGRDCKPTPDSQKSTE